MRSLVLVLACCLAAPALAQEDDAFVGFGFFFMPDRDGVSIVTAVAPESAAETAGMRAGDRIVSVGGVPLPPFNEGDALARARESLPAAFTVARGADTLALSLDVGPYRATPLYRRSAAFLCIHGDCVDGTGVWRQPNGRWYEGEFQDGLRHGQGALTQEDGRVYVGGFVRGVREGPALYRWPDGTYWTGTFRDDQPVPPGVYTDAKGVSRPGLPD
ncbi:MAG: PDZ domain-containing protein [Bacteroidota bacterium]